MRGTPRPTERVWSWWVLVAVLALAWARPAPAATPMQELQGGTDRIIAILEDSTLNGPEKREERRQAVRQVVLDMFEAGEAAKRALAAHWRTLGPAEQRHFVELFVGLLERVYSSKIDLYGGQRLKYLGETVDGEYATVRGSVVTKAGAEVPTEAKMIRRGERWLVYDVVVENVGLIANYRTQFDRIIRTSSFQELVRRLEQQLGNNVQR
jgi:phospholipid transport system substrate-binding protein